ncbi:alkaline phosphatase family protein [Leekyejoonella antrihumi]|uniref:Phosphoesterase n=1 Tax=Leekyejoonella antrihumi TaxID=1660198 RepID=A0A563E6J9_9MICO|nr:alkaline phosphatase family protein [Leekyejoonella antrihumi]TWP38146.1 phosphoesterase [Leekyejoonella antrihumi]
MRLSRNASIAALSAASLVAVGTTAMAATPSHGGGNHHRGSSPAPLDHVYVIMLENHSQSSVIGDPNAPFMTSLAKKYAMADHYYGVTHPSMPNYVATLAGDNFGLQDDNDQNVVNLDRPNLVDQLERQHISWDAYLDTLPADKLARFGPTLSDGTVVQLYAKKHNPFVLFDDIKNDPARMAHVKDYTALEQDLNSRHAPQFVWITPNQCNDMHGGVYQSVAGHSETPCPYGSTKDDANDAALKRKADTFVKGAVNTIMSSRSWTKRSAIVIVTDENDYTGNEETGGWESADGCCDSPYVPAHDPRISADWPGGTYGGGLIPAIVVRDGLQHVVDHTLYNHYSLLTTIEDNWHLGHIGHAGDSAGGVVPMSKAFGINGRQH